MENGGFLSVIVPKFHTAVKIDDEGIFKEEDIKTLRKPSILLKLQPSTTTNEYYQI